MTLIFMVGKVCGRAGAPFMWPLAANPGDLNCELQLPRVRGNNLPPAEGKKRPHRAPKSTPEASPEWTRRPA